jgi:hypothetical protein
MKRPPEPPRGVKGRNQSKEVKEMAKKIQAWTAFGPRLEPATPLGGEELAEQLTEGSNESLSSLLALLAALDRAIEQALKSGRIVHLPNGTHFKPVGKRDGSVDIDVRVSPDVRRRINAGFRGKWRNVENIGLDEEQIVALWNAAHPEDPIEA